MIHVGIHGASGRMGQRIVSLIGSYPDLILTGAFVSPKSPLLGSRVTETLHYETLSLQSLKNSDLLIDFSTPRALMIILPLLREWRKPIVIGTTGFTSQEQQEIQTLSEIIPILWAPNTSIGVNVLSELVRQAAQRLPIEFQPHILESHHTLKKDAPSGTAAQLQQEILNQRPHTDVPINSIRAGDVVGEHVVTFFGLGERLELTHRATSRDIFAKGALQAAQWITNQRPGLYSMKHVLGILT